MVGVCSCVQEKEAIPQKLHQACTDFRSESIFQLWLKQLSTTSHQILFWQLNSTFGKRPCPCTGQSLSCSHRCSQGVQSCCSCTRGCGAQPASNSSFRAADPHGTSRALQGHPAGTEGELSVRPSPHRVRNHCTLFGHSSACCVSAVPTRPFLCLLSFNEKCLRVDFYFFVLIYVFIFSRKSTEQFEISH